MDRHTTWKEIVEAISKFRPGFADRLVPAEQTEIAQLEEAVEHPLLPEYREFLAIMGHGLGGLNIATSDFDLNTIYDIYRGPSPRPPSHLLYIGKQTSVEADYDVCLSLEQGKEGRVIRVLFIEEQQPDGTLRLALPPQPKPFDESLSLQALVFRTAFIQFMLREYGTLLMFVRDRNIYSDRDPVLVHEVFESLGFHRHPLFDAWSSFYERDDALLVFLRPMGSGIQFLLAVRESSASKRFSVVVKERLDMREA